MKPERYKQLCNECGFRIVYCGNTIYAVHRFTPSLWSSKYKDGQMWICTSGKFFINDENKEAITPDKVIMYQNGMREKVFKKDLCRLDKIFKQLKCELKIKKANDDFE